MIRMGRKVNKSSRRHADPRRKRDIAVRCDGQGRVLRAGNSCRTWECVVDGRRLANLASESRPVDLIRCGAESFGGSLLEKS